ncbi:MAG TPA: hypothetical protein EYP59_17385 [Thiotrichaceae bacterium]|nr:hypothetical protein [Thiotrichaceae bacterium]
MYYFDNFKGFSHAELELSKPFTVLIGANGAGKSNLIEAIELLSFVAHGTSLDKITELGREGQLEVRGGLSSCVQQGQEAFSLGFSMQALSYSVKVTVKPFPKIVNEKCFVDSKPILTTKLSEILGQYNLKPPFVFEPNPKLMRQYEPIGSHLLAKNGSNLSAMLFYLQEYAENGSQTLARLLDWIKQLPNEPYQAFDFDITHYQNVMFGLKEGNMSVGANLLSDGTLRSLAILTALETVESHSFIVIEEFDNGLHPSRIKMLIKAILDCCQRQSLNVLVTTHNPATLNALSPEQLASVLLCTGNKVVRFYDLPRCAELLERGQLGELVTRRVIDQYLAPNFEEERQKEALEWLKNLP